MDAGDQRGSTATKPDVKPPTGRSSTEELVWRDENLDSYEHIIFTPSVEQLKGNLLKYFAYLPQRNEYNCDDVELICGLIANMPMIIGANINENENFFTKPANVKEILIDDMISRLTLRRQETIENVDRDYLHWGSRKLFNATVFVNELSARPEKIRGTLAIISLTLLRLAAKSGTEAEGYVNGLLYQDWHLLSEAFCPSRGLFFPKEKLDKLKYQFSNHRVCVNRAIAMCLRKFEPRNVESLLESPGHFFIYYPLRLNGFGVFQVLGPAQKRLTKSLLDIIKDTGNDLLLKQILKVCEFLHMKRTVPNTQLIYYSRLLDGAYHVSISSARIQELICFLAGLSDRDKVGDMYALRNFKDKDIYIKLGDEYKRKLMEAEMDRLIGQLKSG